MLKYQIGQTVMVRVLGLIFSTTLERRKPEARIYKIRLPNGAKTWIHEQAILCVQGENYNEQL